MEIIRHVIKNSRRGALLHTVILSCCLLIVYWIVTKNQQHMVETKSVRGTVYQAATGEPVAGAMVMITAGSYEHPDIAAQSDEQGVFFLPEIKIPGTYTLLIRYNDQAKTVRLTINNDHTIKIPV
jgi:hypothetical protein